MDFRKTLSLFGRNAGTIMSEMYSNPGAAPETPPEHLLDF